jgi:hypothetical protein
MRPLIIVLILSFHITISFGQPETSKTEIYIADNKQEEFAMKGNDIRKTNAQPWLVISINDKNRIILLSNINPK